MSEEVLGEQRSATSLLEVKDLCLSLPGRDRDAQIIDHLDLVVESGTATSIVGESGCGKSTLAKLLIGLRPRKDARVEGSMRFEGREMLGLSESQYRHYRGKEIGIVFQDPTRSFNPLITVGEQIVEAMRLHGGISRSAARARAVELLAMVRIPAPAERFHSYPHQLSGGMRQRVMIAMALSCSPKLLIADEPTTALDVTTQAAIMDLLAGLRQDLGMALVLITHDLHLASCYTERVSVMYAGHIIEQLEAATIVEGARVPYTVGLVDSIPGPADRPHSQLRAIRGYRPDPSALPEGCAFHPRCDRAQEDCRTERPALTREGDGHTLACWHPFDRQGRDAAAPGVRGTVSVD